MYVTPDELAILNKALSEVPVGTIVTLSMFHDGYKWTYVLRWSWDGHNVTFYMTEPLALRYLADHDVMHLPIVLDLPVEAIREWALEKFELVESARRVLSLRQD